MKTFLLLPLLVLGTALHGQAQTKPAATATTPASTAQHDEDVQKHLLSENIDLSKARADELPDLFERFISTTREERRGWTYRNWSDADRVLARLTARYQQVHSELPMEERVRIRAFQAEFRTLKGIRKVGE
ncbi:hypothetical protein GCM10023185_46030 [Hymenobacter saemangeumensis]|uniref:Uncharacterized protein n=1 Tax=Hymenobacter saemangeumensis TaxID=1084522 RepID=A0ABP8ISS0_9BACT